ncbi:MAG: hypothetical protein RLZ75_1824, partial [Pseudomonadota bacterium]
NNSTGLFLNQQRERYLINKLMGMDALTEVNLVMVNRFNGFIL